MEVSSPRLFDDARESCFEQELVYEMPPGQRHQSWGTILAYRVVQRQEELAEITDEEK